MIPGTMLNAIVQHVCEVLNKQICRAIGRDLQKCILILYHEPSASTLIVR